MLLSRRVLQVAASWGRGSRRFGASGAAPRRGNFKAINDEDVAYFKGVVGASYVLTDESELESHNRDWLRHYEGKSEVGLFPKSTEEVSKVLRYCHERRIAVTPQGGNTGLVGGSTPVFDEVIINMRRMNRVLEIDDIMGVVKCEAGCILQNLDEEMRAKGFLMPLDLGAKGSCQIGGNVATNAGGVRFVRYGSLRGSVLGMEAVLADGTVVDSLSMLRKDNTGYDVKQLMIGSEGTLGIITKLAILTPRLPSEVNVAMLSVPSYEALMRALRRARSDLLDILSAVEFMDKATMQICQAYLPGAQRPLEEDAEFNMLIETSGSKRSHDQEKLEEFLGAVLESGLAVDGVLAQNDSQAANLWRLREGAAEALTKHGYTYKYDVSVPTDQMYSLVEIMRDRLGAPDTFDPQGGAINVVGYGHLGDGNLHLNVVTKEFDQGVLDKIEPFLFERVSQMDGSVSAEHGIGRAKAAYLGMSKSQNAIDVMKSIKQLLDPHGILNPYKVLT